MPSAEVFLGLLTGFDGLTAPRVLLMKYGKKYVKQALSSADHLREETMNGGTIRGIYGNIKVERLYREIFDEAPRTGLRFYRGGDSGNR